MSSRQRLLHTLKHQSPDRTPIFEYVLQPPVADAILDRNYVYGSRLTDYIREHGWEKGIRQLATDMVELAQRLGHDLIYATCNVLPAEKSRPAGAAEKLPEDPVVQMEERLKREEEQGFSVAEEAFFIYFCLREEMAARNLDLPILAPACLHGIWTDTVLMEAMVLAPELVRRHYGHRTRLAEVYLKHYHRAGVDLVSVGGDFAGSRGPFCSPRAYREYIVPEVRKVSEMAHRYGFWTLNASDGNLWPVIEDFLLTCQVDGYLEIDAFAGMELGELKRRFGQKITFFGNLDCGALLTFGTPSDVEKATRECLEKGWGNGGHVLCASNAITSSVPLANYLAIYRAYARFFGLKMPEVVKEA
ncbi:MAG TPA: uroporphyrinogen decarboxylase family protein [bacterium]|nr:uroporphyrinogen decarboxylase family protein [bacterium]HPP11223.1 uroporphyrinogen decarboxylase family protein [bacterium]